MREPPFLKEPAPFYVGYFGALVRSLLVMGTFTGLALDAWRSRPHWPPAAAKFPAAPREPAEAPLSSSQ